MNKPTNTPHQQGVALVSTMIVLAVLAIVAVAFMQSSTSDRAASRSGANYYRAQLAAEAGAAVARGTIAQLFADYPDSVTVWQNIGGSDTNEATLLYARALSTNLSKGARPGEFGTNVTFLAFPLLSRTNTNPAVPLSGLGTPVLPFKTNNLDPAVINLNALSGTSGVVPLVGLRTTSSVGPVAPVAAAEWIEILKDPNKPRDLTRDPSTGQPGNPPIGRYAYWVEDESFKVNVNIATAGPRGSGSLGLSPAEARIDGSLQSSASSDLKSAVVSNIITDRALLPDGGFPTVATAALAAELGSPTSVGELQFLTTTRSAGLDLSRGGFKRLNINTVTNGVSSPTNASQIRTNLDRIIAAIVNSNSAPLFGQRFYRSANSLASINNTSTVTPLDANIYLQKIAANILDYIDNDNQPTIINNDGSFTLRTVPVSDPIYARGGGTDGVNSVAAFGVENSPRLQEYAVHARIRSMRWTNSDLNSFGFVSTNTNNQPTTADYEIWIDHYLEFWNPGTTNITISNAVLRLDKLPPFRAGGGTDIPERSLVVSDVNATFPAGAITVLTTAPFLEASVGSSTSDNILTNGMNIVYLSVPDADRKFTGKTTLISTNIRYNQPLALGTDFRYDRLFNLSLDPGPQVKASVLLANSNGILESFVGLPFNAQTNLATVGWILAVSNGYIREGLSGVGFAAVNNDNIRGGSLRGNTNATGANPVPYGSQGDPRALNEQLTFLNFSANSSDADQTRFYVTVTGGGAFPEDSTMGRPNANFVNGSNWVDLSSLDAGAANAPLVVRNGPMQTIGELGHITDPARVAGGSGDISRARGGGRTLRVGQPEFWRTNAGGISWVATNGLQTNASRTWTSWRLADIFTVASSYVTNVPNVPSVTIPGLINPNGALRDNGAALRAAVFGLTFQPSPEGAPATASRPVNTNLFISNLVSRLTNGTVAGFGGGALNPFWERGEISELSGLNTAANGLASGANMSNSFDRGREELIRRSIEMITTRGSVFTVYVVGEGMQVTIDGTGTSARTNTNYLGQVRLKQTFEVAPAWANGTMATNDLFPLSNEVDRFQPVTNFSTRVLNTTYD